MLNVLILLNHKVYSNVAGGFKILQTQKANCLKGFLDHEKRKYITVDYVRQDVSGGWEWSGRVGGWGWGWGGAEEYCTTNQLGSIDVFFPLTGTPSAPGYPGMPIFPVSP